MIYKLLVLMLVILVGPLSGCESCSKYYNINGTVTDTNGAPLAGVEVTIVLLSGSTQSLAATDANGKYAYLWGPAVSMVYSHLLFKKTGFKDADTTGNPMTSGDSCSDQNVVRDVVMTP